MPACFDDLPTGSPVTLIPPSLQLPKSCLEGSVDLSFASELTVPGLVAYSIAADFSASVNQKGLGSDIALSASADGVAANIDIATAFSADLSVAWGSTAGEDLLASNRVEPGQWFPLSHQASSCTPEATLGSKTGMCEPYVRPCGAPPLRCMQDSGGARGWG